LIQKQIRPELLAGYVKREIEEMILSGELKPGDQLPSEVVLAQKMAVSRVTLREAAKLLENVGLLYRQNGIGTFVTLPKPFLSGKLEANFSLTDAARAAGLKIETVRSEFVERIPTEREKLMLNLKDNINVASFSRTRTVEGKPIVTSVDVVPISIIPNGAFEKLGERSLYRFFEEDCGCVVETGEANLSAAVATKIQAELLDLEVGSPLLLIEQLDYDMKKHPLLYSREFYVSERFSFTIHRERNLEQYALEYLEKK
jgi:GntR family transcriptional regulator